MSYVTQLMCKADPLYKLCYMFDDYPNGLSHDALYNLLHRGGIYTVDDFIQVSEDDIKRIRGVGTKRLEFIMGIKNWLTPENIELLKA